MQEAEAKKSAMPLTAHERNCLVILAVLAALQSGHMVEHVAQFIQWMVHMRLAQGIIGEFDLEPIHFGFNSMVLIGISLLCTFYGDVLRGRGGAAARRLMLFAMAVETYHMTEHVAKIMQYVETGLQGTPGILGRYIPLIPMHFVLNLMTTVPLDLAFILTGSYLLVFRMARRLVPRRARAD